jgi:hypothetical protein
VKKANKTVEEKLAWLRSKGCNPRIVKRGNVFRAYINIMGNQWDESEISEEAALDLALEQWERSGRVMDGMTQAEALWEASLKKT